MEGDTDPLPAESTTENVDDATDDKDAIVAPATISQEIVKAAQVDSLQLDVLVCGKCHNVYHFVEGFMEHKSSNECDGDSQVFKGNTEEKKPQVWAFMLWKASHCKDDNPEWASNSWGLYQRWCKLREPIRQTWMEAGKSLQYSTALGHAALEQGKGHGKKSNAQKTTLTPAQLQQQQTLLELQKELEDDETEIMSTLGLVRGSSKTKKDEAREDDKQGKINRVLRRSLKPKLDDEEDSENEEYIVEKIVAKRVNPKTKQPEYLLKWEGFPSDQNTWEPIQNMGTCTKLVQEFEKNLARQKARKAMEANKASKSVIRLEDLVTTPTSLSGRPVRNSAKRALDQVKEWVGMGTKRRLDSDDDSDIDDPVPVRQPVKRITKTTSDLPSIMKSKVLGAAGSKTPVLVANSKGVVRVDPKHVPNLSSGVYILSSQSGLIKVDDPTAAKLTEAMKNEGKKIIIETPNPKVMINETEIRKISKTPILQKGSVRKDTMSPSVKIIQKSSLNKMPLPLRLTSPKLSSLGPGKLLSQLGTKSGTRLLQTASMVSSPGGLKTLKSYKTPVLKPKVTIKTTQASGNKLALRLSQLGQRNSLKERIISEKLSDDDFDGGLPDEFPKEDDPIAPPSPSRPLTLCPLTGEVLGRAEGEKTPPQGGDDDESILPDLDDDGMMRVEMSPGGTIRQVVCKPQPKKQLSLLHKTQKQVRQHHVVAAQVPAEPELISIQGEDGVIYQMTAEQQQMLLQNGTFTMDGRIIQDETTADSEHTEILIQNGQIIQRTILGGSEGVEGEIMEGEEGGEAVIIQNDSSNEEGQVFALEGGDGMLTLDSAVQEAVAEGEVAGGGDDGQMVAQIVQAEPPTPGGGPRKVMLLLPDGNLVHTEMDEEQYQALDFEK